MAKTKKLQFGELPPQYNFVLNPYPDMRISSCPLCEHKTGQQKIPLLIHVEPIHLIALNYTCRYCRECDLLIAYKHELEHLLTGLFSQMEPATVGNEYLIMGTVEKTVWREGLQQPKAVAEMLPHASDFVAYYQELRFMQPGWFPVAQKPPVMEPPPSREWVKSTSGRHRK
jgi:hypothetical protein